MHIPFCAKKCSYCDFHFSTRFGAYREEMILSIVKEIKQRRGEALKPLSSIYFGGGTPSLLTIEETSLLLKTIEEHYQRNKNIEVTLEVNPEDISKEKLRSWLNLGVNRLSIGLQSFKKEDLNWMNRGHTDKDALSCVSFAREVGFTNISVDLMYGLPGLSQKEWKNHIDLVLESGVTHVSAYCLTVEKGTLLSSEIKKGNISVPEDDAIESQYNTLTSQLNNSGFEQYEVSNFAYNKLYSQHNSSYWKGINYIGVGPSAHSFKEGYRRWNIANNPAYIRSLKMNCGYYEEEFLAQKDLWNELFLTGFRTRWGVLKGKINDLGGFTTEEASLLEGYIKNHKIKELKEAYVLTDNGFLFADALAQSFFRVQ